MNGSNGVRRPTLSFIDFLLIENPTLHSWHYKSSPNFNLAFIYLVRRLCVVDYFINTAENVSLSSSFIGEKLYCELHSMIQNAAEVKEDHRK